MSHKAPKSHTVSAIDMSVVEELRDIAFLGYYEDLTPVALFIKKSGLKRTLALLDQKISSNDISLFSKCAMYLSTVLEVVNFVFSDENPEPLAQQVENREMLQRERETVTEFYLEMCKNLRMVYKVYSLRKPLVVNSVTKILQALVEFKNVKVFNELVDNFDFSKQVVHKLFIPTKDDFERKIIDSKSMRAVFIDFWLCLCSAGSVTVRIDLLSNFKMMANFWKYIEKDRFEALGKIFEFLLRYVLNDPLLKRATRTRILNENFLFNVKPLFDYIKAENDRDLDNDDVDDFNRFKTAFQEFMDILVSDKERGISFPENDFGAPMVINNVTFKINNRLIYVLLTILKPWDSYLQLQFTMKILNNNSELLPPYMQWIVSNSGGYHDPSLTSYWIGHTLLYTEILKSSQLPLKTEYIALFPLSGTIQSAILKYSDVLVQQLGLQLILLQLNRLCSPGVPQAVIEAVLNSLPPHSALVPFLLHENKFLKITSTQILSTWERIAPGLSTAPIVSLIGEKLSEFDFGEKSFSGIELVLLDHYLLIQSNNDLKWWNKNGSDNSFFTSLLKLSHLSSLRLKIVRILQSLTATSLAFNKDRDIEDPLLILLDSTNIAINEESAKKLFNCIDEVVARTIKSPYKYLDQSSQKYDNLSIFVVIIFEQLKYIPDYDQETEIHTWLNNFLRGMAVIGEPLEAIENAARDYNIKVDVNLKTINSKSRIILKVDFAETVIVFNRFSDSGKDENVLFDSAKKMGLFLGSVSHEDTTLFRFVTRLSTWTCLGSLNGGEIWESHTVALCLLSDLLSQWFGRVQAMTEIGDFIYKTAQSPLASKNQTLVTRFLFLLSDSQIIELAQHYDNEILVVNIYQELIKRGLKITPDYKALMAINSKEVGSIIHSLPPKEDQLDIILANPQFSNLFEDASKETVDYLLSKQDLHDLVLYYVLSSLRNLALKYQSRTVSLALSFDKWKQSLNIIASNPDFFDWKVVMDSVEAHIKKNPKDAMTSDFTNFVSVALDKSKEEVFVLFLTWINRAMLYVTKKFAESAELSGSFDNFVSSLGDLIAKHRSAVENLLEDIVIAQLEVLLSHAVWIYNEVYLCYANKVLLAVNFKNFDSNKLLHLYVANKKMALHFFPSQETSQIRFQSALLVHTLHHKNVAASSTLLLLENILMLYLGSSRAEDLLLKSVLISMEKRLSKSWVSLVTGWTYVNDMTREECELVGSERLFIKDRSSFIVALQKNFVNNTINSISEVPELPATFSYEGFESFAFKCKSPAYFDTVYDPEFLLLVIASNDDWISFNDGLSTVDVSQLVDSDLLRFVVTALGNSKCKPICKVILHGALKFLQAQEAKFKDKNIFTVHIASILHTLREADHLVAIVWYMIGCFSSILGNPGHHLYNLVCKFVLTNPIIRLYNLPLFKDISSGAIEEDESEDDLYYKQVHWMVDLLRNGVSTPEDVKLFGQKGVLEWAFNLCNSKYVSGSLRNKVLRLIYTMQTVKADGLGLLTTKNACLATLAALKSSISTDKLVDTQLKLNIDQIALRYAIAGSQKRLNEWTLGDFTQAAKRIHLA